MMWLWIFVGALIWQLITTIVAIVVEDDVCPSLIVGGGIPACICLGFFWCCRKVIKFINGRRYVSMLVKDGESWYCTSNDNTCGKLMDVFNYEWNNALQNKYEPEDGWRKEDCFFNSVNIRYTPIKIAKAEGAKPVPKKIIAEAKRKYNEMGY